MHSYLRAIGFSDLKTESDTEKLLEDVYRNYDNRNTVKGDHSAFVEMEKAYAEDMGIILCGDIDQNGFHRQYYFPYYKGSGVTTTEDLIVDKRVSGNSYAGVCDDGRVGISLIFYLQNAASYMKEQIFNRIFGRKTATTFSGLSINGMILLPVQKKESVHAHKSSAAKRNQLMSAAKSGDPEAIENLTIEDMDLYSMISRRVYKEDIYSIVDTFIMPYGIECDQYQVMGNINHYNKVRNKYTGEEIYQINIECNEMNFDICINKKDLMGDPEVGRRFKGTIWLQGRIEFE